MRKKLKYNKLFREGNTNMNYETWKLWNELWKEIPYNESWYKNGD